MTTPLDRLLGHGPHVECVDLGDDVGVHWWPEGPPWPKPGDRCLCGKLVKEPDDLDDQ